MRSRGLGDVYKRQRPDEFLIDGRIAPEERLGACGQPALPFCRVCLLYPSDAADDRSRVDLGGGRLIKKKKREELKKCFSLIIRHIIAHYYTCSQRTRLTKQYL